MTQFITWNVNGIRSALKKGFADFVKKTRPDILCVQESRALEHEVELPLSGYKPYWNPAQKRGYSGTLTLTKQEPLSVTRGMGMAEHDQEGCVLTLEYKDYYLVNVYTPNAIGDEFTKSVDKPLPGKLGKPGPLFIRESVRVAV